MIDCKTRLKDVVQLLHEHSKTKGIHMSTGQHSTHLFVFIFYFSMKNKDF